MDIFLRTSDLPRDIPISTGGFRLEKFDRFIYPS